VQNLKTFFYFSAITALTIFLVNADHIKSIRQLKRVYAQTSEDSKEIYKSKIHAVYNPLDQSYIVTDELKKQIELENNFDSSDSTWPIISLRVDPRDLYSNERGIIKNDQKRGRLWERPAHITYYKNGNAVFNSMIGIRLHGGTSRDGNDPKSFRAYFRKGYQKKSFYNKESLTLKENSPIKRLVLRFDKRYHFSHDLTYKIINKLGGLAPKLQHVALFLNGQLYGHYHMTEHQSEFQLEKNLGHSNFLFYKLKSNNDTTSHLLYEKAIDQVRYASSPISYTEMNQLFNLDNFTAQMATTIFTGMTDWAQGFVFKDLSQQIPRWEWVTWDHDNAFFLDRARLKLKSDTKFWESPGFKIANEFHTGSLRSFLFRRLLSESDEFQRKLVRKIGDIFELLYQSNFFQDQLIHYKSLAGNSNKMNKDINRIKTFIKHRKAFLCQESLEYLKYPIEGCNE